MPIAEYCHNKGMSAQEYETFRSNLKATAKSITDQQIYTHGMYYPVNNILTYSPNSDMRILLINELKKNGFEFIEDYTLYRY